MAARQEAQIGTRHVDRRFMTRSEWFGSGISLTSLALGIVLKEPGLISLGFSTGVLTFIIRDRRTSQAQMNALLNTLERVSHDSYRAGLQGGPPTPSD